MFIKANRSQLIWTPLLGWALLSMTAPAAWGQAVIFDPGSTTTPADVTVVPGGAVAPAGPTGQLPPYTIPGVTAPPGVTYGGTTLGTSTPAPVTPSPTALNNPLILPVTQYSSTGQILYGAPVGMAQTFSGTGAEGEELGTTVGAFTLYPSIDINIGYDNNVFAVNAATTPPTGALYTTIVPQLEFRSNWIRHSVRGLLGGGVGMYAGSPTQNYLNVNTLIDGTIDVHDDFRLTPSIGFRRATEAAGTPNTAVGSLPTVVDSIPLRFGIYQRFNRFYYDVSGSATRYWFQDNSQVSSQSLPAGSRDRWEYAETFRFGYEVSDDVALYVAPSLGQVRYINFVNSVGQERDSNQMGAVVGATWTISPTSSFDGNLGYAGRSYDSGSGFTSTNAWTGQLSGTWNGYAPLTLQPSFSRGINESALTDYTNIVTTAFGLGFNYIIHDAWSATGGISYTLADYTPASTSVVPRTDKIFRGSIGLMYALRPQVSIGPNFEYTQGSSTDPVNGPFYTRQAISVRISAKR